MPEHDAHAHMSTVMTHADCSCGWVGAYHVAAQVGSVLTTWNLAIADRDAHQTTHGEAIE